MAFKPPITVFKSADDTATAVDAQAVTPSDSATLTNGACLALYIGVAGNVALVTSQGTTVTFVGLNAGSILPVRTNKVLATGTTATSILALY